LISVSTALAVAGQQPEDVAFAVDGDSDLDVDRPIDHRPSRAFTTIA
jgi:hypothetical protein